jgi:hypothetical protein
MMAFTAHTANSTVATIPNKGNQNPRAPAAGTIQLMAAMKARYDGDGDAGF